ncbi:hypothetical protein HY503_01435 [Candidatus Woesebacteria bacterium]|nr:hypothetical protein [Candidatus Woesebacteria bacterium]
MLTFRYIFRLLSAFVVRFRGIIFAAAFFGVVIFLAFSLLGLPVLTRSSERTGIVGRYRVENLPDSVLTLIGNGLTKIGNDGTVAPDLADSWQTPDGGQTWIFKLKENIFWQDGKRVTSESINYQFSDAKIEHPDERTIVFTLESPFAPFPFVVAKPTFSKGLLGTGEWRVSKATLSGGFIQRLVMLNKEGDRKILIFYPTEERAKLGFKLGEIDILQGIFNPKPFGEWAVTKVEKEVTTGRYVAIFFNTQDKLLSEKSLRQALSYAIKKDLFDGPRAISPISPSSWAFNPQVKPYNYDTIRAQELIDDLANELKENLTVNIVTSPALLSVAESISRDWEAVGVKGNVQVFSGVPAEYQALLAIFDVPTDPDQYSIWHSTQTSTNITRYQSPRIDKLLEDGRVELNLEERKKIYLDFQRFLVEDSPAAFLYHPTTYVVRRK